MTTTRRRCSGLDRSASCRSRGLLARATVADPSPAPAYRVVVTDITHREPTSGSVLARSRRPGPLSETGAPAGDRVVQVGEHLNGEPFAAQPMTITGLSGTLPATIKGGVLVAQPGMTADVGAPGRHPSSPGARIASSSNLFRCGPGRAVPTITASGVC